MDEAAYLIVGHTGLIGSALLAHLQRKGERVIGICSSTYRDLVGAKTRVLINCNGNAYRYRASQDPAWDFEASVATVQRSLFDFRFDHYVYCSTVDVYDTVDDASRTREEATIHPDRLIPYAFHKWVAEHLIQRYAPRWIILRLGSVLGPGLKKNPVYDLANGQPVHMSLESAPTFIDTDTIAQALDVILARRAEREIFNVTGIGSVPLRHIAAQAGVAVRVAPGAEEATYRYAINTEKLQRVMTLPSAATVVSRYLASIGRGAGVTTCAS